MLIPSLISNGFSSIQFSHSVVPDSLQPTDCSAPGFLVHHQLPELAQTHVHQLGNAIQPSHPLSSPSLPVFNLSQHQGLSNESVLHIRWPKYWSFSFSISPSGECSELISFRIDWLDLLSVQEYSPIPQFKSTSSSKLSIFCHPTLTLIHDYWKNHRLDYMEIFWQSNVSTF